MILCRLAFLTLFFYFHILISGGKGCRRIQKKEDGLLTEKDMCPIPGTRSDDKFPIAMAYVRWQELGNMYQPEMALVRGTLYPELDKPFCGCTVTMGGKRC